tara:strand:- start:428 stop:973 length:546 start_codon:yes stop_codon:yes gene_type:complete
MNNNHSEYTYAPRTILPVLMNIVKPTSVTDWGCNRGYWLEEAKNLGAKSVKGFDMIDYDSEFRISSSEFKQTNFEEEAPLNVSDLGISLENIEHVSTQKANCLHDAICDSCDVVLFSGAVPGQGGTSHVNEQPHSYWHSRFARKGFLLYDFVRWCIYDDPNIYSWYKDNTFLYSRVPLPKQ